MTPESIRRVRASLLLLEPDLSALGPCFYRHLFALAPEARTLFPREMDAQAGKLVDMIASIVALLDEPEQLGRVFAAMGRRHIGYGAREAHYDAVGAALLRAMRETLGVHWSPQLGDAWGEVYGEMAEAMIAAANSVPTEAPAG